MGRGVQVGGTGRDTGDKRKKGGKRDFQSGWNHGGGLRSG